jgi:hypothetical protein
LLVEVADLSRVGAVDADEGRPDGTEISQGLVGVTVGGPELGDDEPGLEDLQKLGRVLVDLGVLGMDLMAVLDERVRLDDLLRRKKAGDDFPAC